MSGEDHLVKRLSEGLAGWISFQQAAWRSKVVSEYFLYPPIFEMTLGRKWKALPQFQLPREPQNAPVAKSSKKGTTKQNETNLRTFDFLFFRPTIKEKKAGLAALEIKFIKTKNAANDLTLDVAKLKSVNGSTVGDGKYKKYGALSRYIMVCGEKNNIEKFFASNRASMRVFKREFETEDFEKVIKGKKSDVGWLCSANSDYDRSYDVIVFKIDID